MDDKILIMIKKDCERLILENAKIGKLDFNDPIKAFFGNKYNMMAKELNPIWQAELDRLENEGVLLRFNGKYIINE